MRAVQLAWLPALAVLGVATAAQAPPRLFGISHVAFRVSDLEKSRAFYEGFLGYAAVPPRKQPEGPSRLLIVVNDQQYVELVAGLDPSQDRLDHIALLTDESKDPAPYTKDAEGHVLEIVARAADGWPGSSAARSGIPARLRHAGVLVGNLDAANRFYEALGFKETWRGGRDPNVLSWTNMRVPDGDDYLEFMLYAELPPPDARGTAHHICLEVPDVEQAKARLAERPYAKGYGRPLEIRTGVNRKRQLNLYDPDGTRVELMEPRTVDGVPAPASTAPPPRPRS